MKLTLISNLYEPYARGGAEVIVKRMAQELATMGHDVSLITTQPWSADHTFKPVITKDEDITIYRYAVPNIFFYTEDIHRPIWQRFFWHVIDLLNIPSVRTVRKILAKIQPDLVITHNMMGMSYFISGALRTRGGKHIHVLHDIQLAVRSGLMRKGEEGAITKNGVLGSLYQAFVRPVLGSPDMVVSPSEFLLQFYNEKGYFPRSKKQVLRNPVGNMFLSVLPNVKGSSYKPKFGYIGQLEKHKGIDLLQQAFYQNEAITGDLEIVGDGSLKSQVQKWAESDQRVVYKGKLPNDKLPEWYQSLDALIMPTLTYENSPTVIYEALASGIPVIATDIGGTAEMITKETGIVIAPEDLKALTKAIINMQEEYRQFDPKKIRASVEALDIGTYCEKILDLAKEL